jgi:hypothetical protein
LLQISGRLSTDSEVAVTKRFENGTITQTQRDNELAAMAARRKEPLIYFNASTNRLQVAETKVTGGLVEMVGSIINTGGGVVRALDGFARLNIDNQTSYGMDLLGLDTGGDAGVIRITDLPPEAQKKLFERKRFRESTRGNALKLIADHDDQ